METIENLQPNVVTYNAAEDTNLRRMTNSRLRASSVSPIEIYALIRLPQTVLIDQIQKFFIKMIRRFPLGHIVALTIWIIISTVIYLYFDARQKPTIAVASADLVSGQIIIPRSIDGHYYVRGAINGHPVDFMVDTGASIVSISHDIALSTDLPGGIPANILTANGTVMGRIVSGQTIEAGGIVVEGLNIGIGVGGNIALLGQNFLRKVDVLQSGDKMVLRVRTQ